LTFIIGEKHVKLRGEVKPTGIKWKEDKHSPRELNSCFSRPGGPGPRG
jgi:hypothetical protein